MIGDQQWDQFQQSEKSCCPKCMFITVFIDADIMIFSTYASEDFRLVSLKDMQRSFMNTL